MHVGVQRQRVALEKSEDGDDSTDAIFAVRKYESPTRMMFEEIEKVGILLLVGAIDSSLSEAVSHLLTDGQVDYLRLSFNPDTAGD